MNKLMMMLHCGSMPRYMAEAGGAGGGGAPSDPPADPKDPPADPKDPPKDPPADPKDPPKEFTDDDFEKGIVTSEAVKKAAGVEGMELSSEIIKGMLPTIRKVGLNPEQANELANELAMQQIAVAKSQAEARAADIKQMNEEAMKIYPDKQSWDAIGDGFKFAFKPGSTMYNTVLGSELGSDPEFLALMKWVGERVAKDRLAGAPGSGGDKPVSYEKALMG